MKQYYWQHSCAITDQGDQLLLEGPCAFCAQEQCISVSRDMCAALQEGRIKDVRQTLPVQELEFLISGACGACLSSGLPPLVLPGFPDRTSEDAELYLCCLEDIENGLHGLLSSLKAPEDKIEDIRSLSTAVRCYADLRSDEATKVPADLQLLLSAIRQEVERLLHGNFPGGALPAIAAGIDAMLKAVEEIYLEED